MINQVKTELDLADPWNRLQYVYENCNVKQLTEGHYIKYDAGGKLNVCGIGWALHAAGFSDDELKTTLGCQIRNIVNPRNVFRALREYGFERKDRIKARACPLPDCNFAGSLQRVLEHLNEPPHKIPIRNIGKLIPIIKNGYKSNPTIADYFFGIIKDFKECI